jgi:hypothetical protein
MNNEYRQLLVKNTNTIMKQNFYAHIYNQVPYQKTNRFPYLFNGIDDETKPYGYESSFTKEKYLNEQQIESKKRIPLQKEI